jgi:hypothetical protein
MVARKRKREEEEAACRQEEEGVISALRVELRSLRAADHDMSVLTAVEFVTSDFGRRVALYKLCSVEARDIRCNGMSQDDSECLKIASPSTLDLAFLKRRARAEGFQV